jgi:cell division protein FtsZ
MTKVDTPAAGLGPKIVVIGVGGAGGNAVNNMIRSNLEGVVFVVANTDAQALNQSLVDESQKIQLGMTVTQGLGAGSKPEIGRAAAEESAEEILSFVKGANMVFITAGMGGGTGTGAAPVVAKIARDAGVLTVGVVTRPFAFEGSGRSKAADGGISELQQFVDTLLVIPNQNLFRLANENTTFADAFKMADNVLYSGVRGVTDLMIMPGLINLDFADIRAVMGEMGKAMMGTGEGSGERRALDAAEAAISNPLLDDVSLNGARGILISITGGYDMTLYEVDEAANRIREEVDSEANIIFGSTFDERLDGKIRVSVVATGIGGGQDGIFRGRDTSGIIGFGKRDQGAKVFDDAFVDDDRGSTYEDVERERVESPRFDDSTEIAKSGVEKNKRRSFSLFGFSGSRSSEQRDARNDRSPIEKNSVQQQGQFQTSDNDEENLDIPSCFRKKK